MNDCGNECYVIGGPFIGANPRCPIHGTDREYVSRDDTASDMAAFIAGLKAHIQDHADFRKRTFSEYRRSTDARDAAEEGRTEGLEMAIEDIDEFVAAWKRDGQ